MFATPWSGECQRELEAFADTFAEFRDVHPMVVLRVRYHDVEALHNQLAESGNTVLDLVDGDYYFVRGEMDFLGEYRDASLMVQLGMGGTDKFYAGYGCKDGVPWDVVRKQFGIHAILDGCMKATTTFTAMGRWEELHGQYLALADPSRDTSFGLPEEYTYFRTHFARFVGPKPKEEEAANKLGFGYGRIAAAMGQDSVTTETRSIPIFLKQHLGLPDEAVPILEKMVKRLMEFRATEGYDFKKRRGHT